MVTFQYWTNGHIIPGLTVTSWSCWGLLFLFFPPTTPWYSMFTYIKLTKVANPHILETAITNLMHFASLMTTDGPNCGQLGLISCQADRLADSWLDKTDLCFINHSLVTVSGAISGRTGPAWHAFNALLSKMVACSSATLTCWNDCSQ